MIDFMASPHRRQGVATVLSVCRAGASPRHQENGAGQQMVGCHNKVLGEFLAREGVAVCGAVTNELPPAEFQKIKHARHMLMAYELGARLPR